MTLENLAAPGAAAEITAPDLSQETPGVATPDAGTDPQDEGKPEPLTPEQRLEKERATFQRRLNRKHHDLAQTQAELRVAREQLQQRTPPAQTPAEGEPTKPLEPERMQELIRQEAQRLTQETTFRERVGRVLESGSKLPDFDALCNQVSDEMPFLDGQGRPTTFMRTVLDADKPHELLAHLGKNPELLEGLQGLSEGQMSRRLDRIEQSIKQSAEPRASKAPAPLKPVSGSQGAGGDPAPDSPDFFAWKLKKLRGGG